VFISVPHLTQAIITWAEHWNKKPHIIHLESRRRRHHHKVNRGRETLNQIKTQTDH
jgi:hypothetical protein